MSNVTTPSILMQALALKLSLSVGDKGNVSSYVYATTYQMRIDQKIFMKYMRKRSSRVMSVNERTWTRLFYESVLIIDSGFVEVDPIWIHEDDIRISCS